MKKIIIIWMLFVLGMFVNAHLFSQTDSLIKIEELSKPGYTVYKSASTGQYYIEALLIPTPNGFTMADGNNLIFFSKELRREDYDFVIDYMQFRSSYYKIFK